MSPRRLLVVGATGPTGLHVVAQALAAGHTVTAFVRSPQKLPAGDGRLRVIVGSVTDDAAAVAEAVRGHDAVISTLGVGKALRSGNLIARSARTIVSAMEAAGTRRLVFTSAFGVGESRKDAPLVPRLMFRLMLRDVYADKAVGEALVRASALDWTLVCPVILTDAPATGRWRAGEHLPLRGVPTIARADVAAFLLAQVDDPTYLRKSPVVAA
jgi:putative NADH-flavin reductase